MLDLGAGRGGKLSAEGERWTCRCLIDDLGASGNVIGDADVGDKDDSNIWSDPRFVVARMQMGQLCMAFAEHAALKDRMALYDCGRWCGISP